MARGAVLTDQSLRVPRAVTLPRHIVTDPFGDIPMLVTATFVTPYNNQIFHII